MNACLTCLYPAARATTSCVQCCVWCIAYRMFYDWEYRSVPLRDRNRFPQPAFARDVARHLGLCAYYNLA